MTDGKNSFKEWVLARLWLLPHFIVDSPIWFDPGMSIMTQESMQSQTGLYSTEYPKTILHPKPIVTIGITRQIPYGVRTLSLESCI